MSGAKLERRIDDCLAAAQLTDRRRNAVKTFSGGGQRRLNPAASLLHSPKLLLCDEPTVGIEPQWRNAIFDLLQQLNRDGLTIIYSTHCMEEATRLCSRIGIIDHGKILGIGSLDELLAQLPSAEVVTFPRAGIPAAAVEQLAPFGELRQVSEQYEVREGFKANRHRFALVLPSDATSDEKFGVRLENCCSIRATILKHRW